MAPWYLAGVKQARSRNGTGVERHLWGQHGIRPGGPGDVRGRAARQRSRGRCRRPFGPPRAGGAVRRDACAAARPPAPGAAGLRSCVLLPLRVWRSWIGEQGTGGGREGSSVAAGSRRVIAGVSGSLRSLGALRAAVAEARSARAGLLAVLAWAPAGGEIAYVRAPCPLLLRLWEQAAHERIRDAFDEAFVCLRV